MPQHMAQQYHAKMASTGQHWTLVGIGEHYCISNGHSAMQGTMASLLMILSTAYSGPKTSPRSSVFITISAISGQ